MKKVIAWLLVLALTAAVSIGATLAYLTDTDEDVNVMTLGKVKIDQLEYERIDDETKDEDAKVQEFHDNKPLYPGVYEDGFDFGTEDNYVNWGQIGKNGYTSGIWNPDKINNEVDKMVFVENKGDYDAYVRSVFAFEAGNYATLDEFQKMVHLNLNETDWTWEWAEAPVTIGESTYFIATATYNDILAPGALTEISLSQIALDKTATNADVEAFGETYQVLVKTQGIQADGFDDPDTALTEGFGEIITNNGTDDAPELVVDPEAEDFPFEDDNPIEGTNLYNALRYLEGDTAKTNITAQVKNVVFGLNSEYPEIVDNYDGTLVDEQQDVPVHAYYVPSTSTYASTASSNYDVYFLANDVIYTPVDSTGLFQDMTALTSIDSANLDTGRTQFFTKALRGCTALVEVKGIEDWDVSNVTHMTQMFRQSGVTQLDISGWDVSSVVNMSQFMAYCNNLKSVDVSDWQVDSLQDATYMFYSCSNLESVDASAWNADSLQNASQMFRGCGKLKSADVSGWQADSLQNASIMFYGCSNLKSVDASGWQADSLQDASNMFNGCTSLETVDTTGWETASLQNTSYMFAQCNSLNDLRGTGDWETSNVTTMAYMFDRCYALPALEGSENWDVSNVTTMKGMFWDAHSLADIDVSTWNPKNVTDMYSMFSDCYALQELNADNWNVGKVTNMFSMFKNCTSLVTVGAANWNTGSLVEAGAMFTNCSKLEYVDVSKWDTSNVTSMHAMFSACTSLETLEVSNWDVSKVMDFSLMFQGAGSNANDMKLKKLNVSKWQPTSAVKMNHMFYGCAQLTELNMSNWYMPNLYTTSHMLADCNNLEVIDVSGWQTSEKWLSMDAMFNDCRKVKFLDVSSFTTSGVTEFSQIFEACWALEEIKGLENWDTSNGKSFDQTFLTCSSLKELNLSSFDTRNAMYGNKHLNGDISQGFSQMFSGANKLEKLTLGANFDFDGNGTVTAKVTLPNPAPIGDQATKWYNEANDTYYAASEIPEPGDEVVTYVAKIPPANP